MGNESGTWILYGLEPTDPACIHTPGQLEDYIDEVGFLPLFKNDVPGFSVEEHTESGYWWSGDRARDPWEWRGMIAAGGRIAYGKFFDRKAGFISRAWLPAFANARRDGYDFDSLWEEGKAPARQKKIMELFDNETEIFSNELKERAGFGKGGEKNFDGVVTELQMKLYLSVRDFRQRRNKRGEEYGWALAVYCKPEHLWGYEHMASAYGETPEQSRARIEARMRELYPSVTEKQLKRL